MVDFLAAVAFDQDAVQAIAERRGAAGPVPGSGGVTLAPQDVVGLDPAVLGGPEGLDHGQGLAGDARRVGEVAVRGQDQHAVLVVELLADRGQLLDAAEALAVLTRIRLTVMTPVWISRSICW